MKICYLGTAAAERIPGMFCNCPLCQRALALGGKDIRTQAQVLIDDRLLVDFSGDTWQHFMALGKTLWDIENVLITHSHVDHFTFESFALRTPSNAKGVKAKRLRFFTSREVIDRLWECLRTRGNKKLDKLSQCVEFIPMEYYRPFAVDGFTVTPLPAEHAGDEQAFLFLIEKEGKTLFYCNDTGWFDSHIDDYLARQGKCIDLMSMDCTKGDNPFTYTTHMSMEEGNAILRRFRQRGLVHEGTALWFTHFSHNCGQTHRELEQAAARFGFRVAYDGCETEL